MYGVLRVLQTSVLGTLAFYPLVEFNTLEQISSPDKPETISSRNYQVSN